MAWTKHWRWKFPPNSQNWVKICFWKSLKNLVQFPTILATPYFWQLSCSKKLLCFHSFKFHELVCYSSSLMMIHINGITIKSSSLYFASVCTLYMFSITIWPVGELWGPTLLQKQPISVLLELRLLPHGDKSILKFQKKSKCCYKLIIKILN